MNTPMVSILIVTWNRRADLARCLDSALAQTYANTEIVVVDNGSTDGTAALVRERYPEARLVCAPTNLGCPSGRNFGVPYCMGDYIYMLDDDGWLQSDALEVAVRRAENQPALGVVSSRVCCVEGGRVTARSPEGQEAPVHRGEFSGGCSLLRRAALEQVGLFPEDFVRQGEEGDLALRLWDAGWACFLEPASIMFHKPNPHGRDTAAFFYYTLRNTTRTALRLWPMPWCLGRVGLNLIRALRHDLSPGSPRLLGRLLVALARDLRTLPGHRRPVAVETLRLFRQLNKTGGMGEPSPELVRILGKRDLSVGRNSVEPTSERSETSGASIFRERPSGPGQRTRGPGNATHVASRNAQDSREPRPTFEFMDPVDARARVAASREPNAK